MLNLIFLVEMVKILDILWNVQYRNFLINKTFLKSHLSKILFSIIRKQLTFSDDSK